MESFQHDLSSCCGNKQLLQEKFGDGTYLNQLARLDSSSSHFQWIANELCDQGEDGLLVAKWFLQREALEHQQGRPCAMTTCCNLLYSFVRELGSGRTTFPRSSLVKLLTEQPQKLFFNELFSSKKVLTTLRRFTDEDNNGWDYLSDETSLFFGEALLAVEDEEACNILTKELVVLSSSKVFNAWLSHPLLAEEAYNQLKEAFFRDIGQWKEDCPDFMAKLEKENMLDGVFGAYMAKKGVSLPSSSKKM